MSTLFGTSSLAFGVFGLTSLRVGGVLHKFLLVVSWLVFEVEGTLLFASE